MTVHDTLHQLLSASQNILHNINDCDPKKTPFLNTKALKQITFLKGELLEGMKFCFSLDLKPQKVVEIKMAA